MTDRPSKSYFMYGLIAATCLLTAGAALLLMIQL